MVSKEVAEVVNKYINEVKKYFKSIPADVAESAEKRLRADIIAKIKEKKKKKEKNITVEDAEEIIKIFGEPYRVALIYMAIFNYVPKVPAWIVTMEVMAGFMVSLIPSLYTFPLGFYLLMVALFSISRYRWAVELQKITIIITLIIYSVMVFLSSYALLSMVITSTMFYLNFGNPLAYVIIALPITIAVLLTYLIWRYIPVVIKIMPLIPPSLKYRQFKRK